MSSAAEKIEAARERRHLSKAELARRARVPASWVRSLATGKIHRGDPDRLRRVADVLGLDHRELLALTDQLGALEAMEAPVAAPSDLARLAAAIEAQTAAISALVGELRASREGMPEWALAVVSAQRMLQEGLAPDADGLRAALRLGQG